MSKSRHPFVTTARAPSIALSAVTILGTNAIDGLKGCLISVVQRNMPELRSSYAPIVCFEQQTNIWPQKYP